MADKAPIGPRDRRLGALPKWAIDNPAVRALCERAQLFLYAVLNTYAEYKHNRQRVIDRLIARAEGRRHGSAEPPPEPEKADRRRGRLPRWALNYPQVVMLSDRDPIFRRQVCEVRELHSRDRDELRSFLIAKADRLCQ